MLDSKLEELSTACWVDSDRHLQVARDPMDLHLRVVQVAQVVQVAMVVHQVLQDLPRTAMGLQARQVPLRLANLALQVPVEVVVVVVSKMAHLRLHLHCLGQATAVVVCWIVVVVAIAIVESWAMLRKVADQDMIVLMSVHSAGCLLVHRLCIVMLCFVQWLAGVRTSANHWAA